MLNSRPAAAPELKQPVRGEPVRQERVSVLRNSLLPVRGRSRSGDQPSALCDDLACTQLQRLGRRTERREKGVMSFANEGVAVLIVVNVLAAVTRLLVLPRPPVWITALVVSGVILLCLCLMILVARRHRPGTVTRGEGPGSAVSRRLNRALPIIFMVVGAVLAASGALTLIWVQPNALQAVPGIIYILGGLLLVTISIQEANHRTQRRP